MKKTRNELFKALWNAATHAVHSKGVTATQMKAFMIGFLFYRFISENITSYINKSMLEAGVKDFDYRNYDDEKSLEYRKAIVEEKGFFIKPSDLFENVRKNARNDEDLNVTLSEIFHNIEHSAVGTETEDDIKGLFSDLKLDNSYLGATTAERNDQLLRFMDAVGDAELGNFEESNIDIFGDAYEYLMAMYATNSGKKGGEFYTPQEVSELLARLTTIGKTKVNKVYDPACGSGSLLLKFAKILGKENIENGFFGQEINIETYNLARMNMFLHDINPNDFNIALGNTLTNPLHLDNEPFEAIVSNPPYRTKWDGSKIATTINDPRFAPAGILAPDSKADYAFIMHILSQLSASGAAAVVEYPGILHTGQAEGKIRQYLVENNFIDTIINLPQDMFFGTSIATCILILKKNKTDDKILFIDASKEFVREGIKNRLSPENQNRIIEAVKNRQTEQYFSKLATFEEIKENDFNLSVSNFVEKEDTSEKIDIAELNAEIREIVARQTKLRAEIDAIIAEIEGKK